MTYRLMDEGFIALRLFWWVELPGMVAVRHKLHVISRCNFKKLIWMIPLILLGLQPESGGAQPHPSPLSSDEKMRLAYQIVMIQQDTEEELTDDAADWNLEIQEQINDILWFLDNPLSPYLFTRSRLENLPLLTESEITLLLQENKKSPLHSWEQVLRIKGFTPENPELIRHFFIFDPKRNRIPFELEALSRVQWVLSGYPQSRGQQQSKSFSKETQILQKQLHVTMEKWRLSGLWNTSGQESFFSKADSRYSWNITRYSSRHYLILGDFRAGSGSGILLSQSSGTHITGRGSTLTRFSTRPAMSGSASGTLRGVSLGFKIGKSFEVDGLFSSPVFYATSHPASAKSQPLTAVRIKQDMDAFRSQVVIVQHLHNGTGISLGMSTVMSPHQKLISAIQKVVLSGEWNAMSPGLRNSWRQAFQLQNEWALKGSVHLHFGYRQFSQGYDWSSGSLDLQLTDLEPERTIWTVARWTIYPNERVERITFHFSALQTASISTSQDHPLGLKKESLQFSIGMYNARKDELTLTSRWSSENGLNVTQTPGNFNTEVSFGHGLHAEYSGIWEHWQLLEAQKWQNTLAHKTIYSNSNLPLLIVNRLRIQHSSSWNQAKNMPLEHGLVLGHDIQLIRNSVSLKVKWAVYRTTTSTAARLAEEHLYQSFSTIYTGGAGTYQSVQITYEPQTPSKQILNKFTVWVQLSRQERLKHIAESAGLTLEPVRYRITLQARIRF